MITSREPIYPISKAIDFMGMYTVETRGLWQVEGDFMGGSFLQYSFVDEPTGRMINYSAYVYAPNKEKRDFYASTGRNFLFFHRQIINSIFLPVVILFHSNSEFNSSVT